MGRLGLFSSRLEAKGSSCAPYAITPRSGSQVVEYCWGTSLDALAPPYDFVVACDCVYVERLVDVLVSSMVRLSGRSTTVLVASEKREELTYARFRERLARDFTVRQAPRRHMDKAHDHENSEVLLCKLRRPAKDPRSKSRSEGSLTQEVVPGGNRTAGEGLAARDLACGDQERREKRDGPPSVAAGAEPPHPGTPSNTLALDVHKKRTTNPDDGVDLSLDSVRLGSPRVVDGSQPGGSPGEAPATLDERPER